ncbi:MAG: glycosyltransferase family 4 protein [Anaerolineales bacterium]|nr:glycosyltransferase family 4 protein [Anaerolineales bacterium]
MHIGLDASRVTVARRTGTERYARRLIEALLAQPSPHTFSLYFRDPPPPGWPPVPASPGARAPTLRVIPFPRLWTHLRLSFELLARRPRPDALFVPAHVLPLVHPLPTVVTIHDLGYRRFPQAHPPGQRRYLDWSTRFSARFAAHLLADSAATRRDLAEFYGAPPEKVTVVYPGGPEGLTRVDPAPVRARYGLPDDYVLHVGTLQPRKNLARLMEAVAALRGRWPGLALVLAGRPGWLAEPLLAQAHACSAFVRLLDYVPAADLPGLYSGARVFAFPSLYEGFGFPVLEAMACGTPVVCANTASLPELAGEAALLVDPADTEALAAALGRVLGEPNLRAGLAARGYVQLQRFSWDRAAQQTLAVLEMAARRV